MFSSKGYHCRTMLPAVLKKQSSVMAPIRNNITSRFTNLDTSVSSTKILSAIWNKFQSFSSIRSPIEQIEQSDDDKASTTTPMMTDLSQQQQPRRFVAIPLNTMNQKLKPYIVKRRLARLQIYEGKEKNIRHSPWRLNLICQLVAGLPLQEALNQLEFSKKSKAPLVQKVIKRTSNLANIRDGIQMSQLEVAECFATKGTPLKRLKTMGRGRTGKMERQHSHIRVVLREIDFKLKFYQSFTIGQKKRWIQLQQRAENDYQIAKKERDDIEQLQKLTSSSTKTKK